MLKKTDKAKDIIKQLTIDKKTVDEVKALCIDEQEWLCVSSKAYSLYIKEAKQVRKRNENKQHVSSTPNSAISDIFNLNDKLSDYALGIPVTATTSDRKAIAKLAIGLPDTEEKLFEHIELFNMSPKFRAMQKNGRFKHYKVFKEFEQIIDAALVCFYRSNYISCFLTLAPVIEGVLLRWIGYDAATDKLNFDNYRSFFKKGASRNPCPGNVQFHEVFSKLCDNILNKHLYKPTSSGDAYGDFNRHSAIHLLKTPEFGTKNNCIRLFMLIDFMTEIYWYEGLFQDPRFSLKPIDFDADLVIYANLIIDQRILSESAEQKLLQKKSTLTK
jgi:hypothetical protein